MVVHSSVPLCDPEVRDWLKLFYQLASHDSLPYKFKTGEWCGGITHHFRLLNLPTDWTWTWRKSNLAKSYKDITKLCVTCVHDIIYNFHVFSQLTMWKIFLWNQHTPGPDIGMILYLCQENIRHCTACMSFSDVKATWTCAIVRNAG